MIDVEQATLNGRRVRLRAIVEDDYDFLFHLSADEATGYRWRYRGSAPRPDHFVDLSWQGVLTQYLVEDRRSHERLGLVVAYRSHPSGFTYLGVLARPELAGTGVLIEATVLFLEYLFVNWPLRKVYVEAMEFNLGRFSSGVGRLFQEEGRLRDHDWFAGRYWDQVILGITRAEWDARRDRLLPRR